MKVLNVAEKNDSAKHIAEMMTRGRSTRLVFFISNLSWGKLRCVLVALDFDLVVYSSAFGLH